MDALASSSSRVAACPASWSCRKGGMNVGRTQTRTSQIVLRKSFSFVRNGELTSRFNAERGSHARSGMRMAGRVVAVAEVATEEASDGPPTNAGSDDISGIIELLKTAGKTKKVPATEVCAAFKALEKRKLDPAEFPSVIGGAKSPGRTWMAVFYSKKEHLASPEGGGSYYPITAVQSFNEEASEIENGVFLGPLGNFTLTGGYSWSNRKMSFYFHTVGLTVGPLGPLKFGIAAKDKEITKQDAFFLWFYADDEIIVSRGRGGGIAMWVRCKNVSKSLKRG